MRKTLGSLLTVTGALIAVAPATSFAQDYFREYGTSRSSGGFGPVTPGDYTYSDISPSGLQTAGSTPFETPEMNDEQRNFAIGPVRFALAAGIGIEFNDNITLSDDNRQSDIVIRPLMEIDAMYRMSELNTIRLSLGISYAKYLDHSQYDTEGLLISPTSDVEFRFGLGQVMFTVRDRFSYQEDPYDVPQLSNVAQYGRYENQIGIKAEYKLNEQVKIEAGFDHYNLWTKEDAFGDQDRTIDTIFVKPSYGITPTLRVGLNGTYSFITFDSSDRSDGQSYFIGPWVQWEISATTNLYLEAGWQSLTFDGAYTPTKLLDSLTGDFTQGQIDAIRNGVTDQEDSDSFYVRFEIDNKPSEIFQHRLSFSKTSEVGFFSDYYDLYHVEYNAEYKGIYKTSIGPCLFYEHYETSGDLGEKADRVGALVGIRHYLTNNLTLGLDYRFLWKDSNIQGSDYYQNLVFLSAYYKF